MAPRGIPAGVGRLNLELFRSQYDNGAELAADLSAREFFPYFDIRFQHAFYGSQQYGVPREHLSKDRKFPFSPNWIYSLSLLHNQLLRTMRAQFNPRRFFLDHGYDPYYAEPGVSTIADPTVLIWHVRDEFGIGEPGVNFYPYWKNEEYVQLTPAHMNETEKLSQMLTAEITVTVTVSTRTERVPSLATR